MIKESKSLANIRKEGVQRKYNPEPFIARIKALVAQNNLSPRAASLGARLDTHALLRLYYGKRPNMMACILLADYFGLNPNELLDLGAWPTLEIFDIRTESAENLPPEAVEVALAIARIENPGERYQVAEAVMLLLKKFFD